MRGAPLVLTLLLTAPVMAGCLWSGDDSEEGRGHVPADLVIHAGRVWTGSYGPESNTAGVPVFAGSLAIMDQRISAVGSRAEIERYVGDDTRVIDVPDGFVMPGLRDNHNHLVQYANPNPDPERRRTGAAAAEQYRPVHDPNPAESAAFRAGVFALHSTIFAQERTPVDDCMDNPVTPEMKDAILVAQEEALKQGLVSTVEAGLDDLGQWRALQELEAADQLRLRFLVRFAWGCLEQAAEMGLQTGSGGDWVKVLGAKLYSDGWLGPRSAALQEPYDDRPMFDGYLFLDAERANADVARAVELGFHPTTHAIGDRAIATILDAYEANGVAADDLWGIEHASVLPADLFARMRDLGVVASIQLSFATSDQGFLGDAIGAREAHTYPWRSMYEAGIPMAGSSDFQIEALHPLWGVQRAVTRQEVDGTPDGGYMSDEALSVEQALRLVSVDAARAALEWPRNETDDLPRGALYPGFAADFVILERDLFAIPPTEIAATALLATIVNGQVAWEGRVAYPPLAAVRLVDVGQGGHGHDHGGDVHVDH